MTVDSAISQVQERSNILRSVECDFEKHTWTFSAPWMVVGAGEYVAIPKADWDAFLSNIRGSNNGREQR
jgi:hypothetical protein